MHFRFLPIFIILVLPTVSLPAAPPSVPDIVSRFADASTGPGVIVDALAVEIGHATFRISGTAAPVLAGEERVGLYVSGRGTMQYEVVDQAEFPVVRYNAKTLGIKITASGETLTIARPIDDLLLIGEPLPELSGSATETPEAAYRKHRETLARAWGTPLEQYFALKAIDWPSARLQRVTFSSEGQLFSFLYDEYDYPNEMLEVLRPPATRIDPITRNRLFHHGISVQPVGRTPRDPAPPARYVITDVDLTLTASDKHDASISVTETIVPIGRGAKALSFLMISEFYVEESSAPRRFHVRKVTDEKGRELTFAHNGNDLVVGLAEEAPAAMPLKLTFEIDGNFLYRPGGDNYWELGVEPWFPQSMLRDAYTFHGVAKVRKPFVPFMSGTTVRRGEEGDFNVLETRLTNPSHFVVILAGRYAFDEETRDGLTVRVASYAGKNTQALRQLKNLAYSIIDYYSTFLGSFPVSELNIIQKNDYGYGQAPAGVMFITNEAFVPKHKEANEWVRGINERFAHEIAHQYWGNAVRYPNREEQWLSEAFAEYCAALVIKTAKGNGAFQNILNGWKADAKAAGAAAPIPYVDRLRNPSDPTGRFMIRQQILYSKGALLLAGLHRELGDEMFLTFLKSYQRSFRWKEGSTQHVIGLLQVLTKKDYTPFFEQYFYGTDIPKL